MKSEHLFPAGEEGIQFTYSNNFTLPGNLTEGNISDWLNKVAQGNGHTIYSLGINFLSDEELHSYNLQYLNHDTYTDVITFPYRNEPIEGDILISVDRVKENASAQNGVAFAEELLRVIIHGLLHLCGYRDDTDEEKDRIRAQEDRYLRLYPDSSESGNHKKHKG